MSSIHLPEGSHVFPVDLQRRLQEVDPNMFFRLCKSEACRRPGCVSWVVCRSEENGSVRFVAHSKTAHAPESIIPMLKKRLAPNAPDVVAEVEAANARKESEDAAKTAEAAEDTANRIYDALKD